jgi:hypothetical protein
VANSAASNSRMQRNSHEALVCALALVMIVGAVPAQAQLPSGQQGPKLVGLVHLAMPRKVPLSRFPVTGTPSLWAGPAIVEESRLAVVVMVLAGVFTRSAGVWGQQGTKLVGEGTDGPYPAVWPGNFGASVSLSGDGNTAIIGGPHASRDRGGVLVFIRSAGVWSQQGELYGADAIRCDRVITNFGPAAQGWSVSLSNDGNTAIVGGPEDNCFTGAAWVFTRSDGVWNQQAKLVDTTGSYQGVAVSLSGDGNTALVGSSDAMWVFTRTAGVWRQQAKLFGTGGIPDSSQGWSVSLSNDGNIAIMGGPNDNNGVGAAWVFTRSAGAWSQQGEKLVGTGSSGASQQGLSVSLSGDGNTAVVGGVGDNNNVGAAWVFTRSAGVWSQLGEKLVGASAVGPAYQGAVSVADDGHTLAVGGAGDNNNVGATWVFTPAFAGTRGYSNCYGQSVAAVTRQYGDINAATSALGYASVPALQTAIRTFCQV